MALSVLFNEEFYSKLLAELRTFNVTVDANILTQGFQAMASALATIEAYRARCATILVDFIPQKTKARIQMDSFKFRYETMLDQMLNTNPEVLSCSSDRQRVAKANQKLVVEREELMNATAVFKNFTAINSVIQVTMDRLATQATSLTEIINMYKRTLPPVQPSSWGQSFQQVYPPRTT